MSRRAHDDLLRGHLHGGDTVSGALLCPLDEFEQKLEIYDSPCGSSGGHLDPIRGLLRQRARAVSTPERALPQRARRV